MSRFDDARKIEVKPRGSSSRPLLPTDPAEASAVEEAVEALLHFSCPACLHMLSAAKTRTAQPVQCPDCQAQIMPPQQVSMGIAAGTGKTSLPPPRKTGMLPHQG